MQMQEVWAVDNAREKAKAADEIQQHIVKAEWVRRQGQRWLYKNPLCEFCKIGRTAGVVRHWWHNFLVDGAVHRDWRPACESCMDKYPNQDAVTRVPKK